MRKLDFLIPIYNEGEQVIKTLLDSILVQQAVDLKNDIGVIICCDGGATTISEQLKSLYPFEIEYYRCEHKGVSAARNACLDHSNAEYVMFCDCDDMMLNACGLYIIFREMEKDGFDVLTSVFVEETKNFDTGERVYVNREGDSTFVHGKIYRRAYLQSNNIRFNDNLTIHEDSYFNCLAQRLAPNGIKYCQVPFYLWRWRDDSVCRHDPKYILKTYNNMLDSNTALIHEFLNRGYKEDAQFYATSMIYDAYFMMNKDEWLNQENQKYRKKTELRFAQYYKDFKPQFEAIPREYRQQIIVGMKNRFFQEGMFMESITFDDWIKHILTLQEV